MKCPYCEKEMSCGYLYNGRQPICWIPAEDCPPLLAFRKSAQGVTLRHKEASAVSGYKAEAFYCDACGIVIEHASARS